MGNVFLNVNVILDSLCLVYCAFTRRGFMEGALNSDNLEPVSFF
jgi:hypothetical protein